MAFEIGNKHGKGRPPGTPNKTTAQIKDYLQTVSEYLETELMSDIDVLNPIERVKLWLSIQEYLIPKLGRMQISDSDNEVNITISYPDDL
jgi:hypothetical protein